ncbi:RNA 2',3'-cyclic phosphodiesterase [Anaerolineales bacterium HSG24]|nr:RNA 2',3'-cyclic phosphodiesterase [Anaerolineales bacterium HSG24]
METIRAFIAIELSTEVKTAVGQLQSRLKPIVPYHAMRWTTPKNIHLTLHFLGNTPISQIETIKTVMKQAVQGSTTFLLQVENVGCFPNLHRPRVVWVGLTGNVMPLLTLHKKLGQHLAREIDFKVDRRVYSPHLTIGRVKNLLAPPKLRQFGQAIERQNANKLGILPIHGIVLIQSELTPKGPIYTSIAHAEF